MIFEQKYFSHNRPELLITDPISLSDEVVKATSWDIGQYMYCNYLLPSLWRHKFWN